jgi:hexosaminidase
MTIPTHFLSILGIFALGLFTHLAGASTPLSLVPLPQVVMPQEGAAFILNTDTKITYTSNDGKAPAELLAIGLRPATGFTLSVDQADAAAPNTIHLAQVENLENREAYQLNANSNQVVITASQPGGLVNGGQTLRQLLPVEIFSSKPSTDVTWQIAPVTIQDSPTYPWRGMMLDVSRYFFNKEYILRYLDIMAMHKVNVLHWHLIDDCGWRLEIKKYPKLTEIGAWRGKGEQRYGGFYTQEDIKEIVAYASARNITVVPEIAIPAHALSALASYPELGCLGQQFEVPTGHSISPEIYCVGKETTWDFLEDVMDEVVQLFPSKFIHIGGDEARYGRWDECPNCQARMKEQDLTTPQQLQGWTSTRIEQYLQQYNRLIIGWAEILECGVTNKAGIMPWHTARHVSDGAKHGNPVVAALIRHAYFDTPESKLDGEPAAAAWTPPVTLGKAYNWDPTPDELIGTPEAKNILGVNACVWTDQFLHAAESLADKPGEGTTHSEAYVDYLSLPRMAALAEVGWTSRDLRDFDDFRVRMAPTYKRYLLAGYNFRMPTPELTETREGGGQLYITATSPISDGSVRYTLDGSTPTIDSSVLVGGTVVAKGVSFKAVTFSEDGSAHSLVENRSTEINEYSKDGHLIGKWEAGKIGNKSPLEVTFDATGLIDANGDYIITFIYESGGTRLDIDGIEVVRNDVDPVDKDMHHGFTGAHSKDNTYHITVNNYQTGASFKVKAQIYGDVDQNSNGVVLIRKK